MNSRTIGFIWHDIFLNTLSVDLSLKINEPVCVTHLWLSLRAGGINETFLFSWKWNVSYGIDKTCKRTGFFVYHFPNVHKFRSIRSSRSNLFTRSQIKWQKSRNVFFFNVIHWLSTSSIVSQLTNDKLKRNLVWSVLFYGLCLWSKSRSGLLVTPITLRFRCWNSWASHKSERNRRSFVSTVCDIQVNFFVFLILCSLMGHVFSGGNVYKGLPFASTQWFFRGKLVCAPKYSAQKFDRFMVEIWLEFQMIIESI